MKPYPRYKDSGVEWIGEVPAHWEIKRLKYIASINEENLSEKTDANIEIKYVDIGNVCLGTIVNEPETMYFKDAPSRARRIVKKGDTIISTVRTYLKAITYIPEVTKNLIVSTGFAVIRPKDDFDKKFISFLLTSEKFVDTICSLSVGVSYPALNAKDIANITIWFSQDKTEQKSIVAYLDRKTTQIDNLISKKQKLIELLKEERAATINQAVTKGLNPDAPMKDSGIEWLGEIPAHWEVKRLKYFFRLITEKNCSLQTKKVALENIESWTGRFIDSEVDYQGEGISFLTGDVLFGKLRPYLAKVLNAKFSGASVGDIFVMRPKLGISSRFAFYRFLSKPFIDIVNGSTFGAKMPRVSWDFIANLHIVMPNNNEQRTISDYLDRKTTRIDQTTSKIGKQIDLLQEYRTALISGVVTGKIDVSDEGLNG